MVDQLPLISLGLLPLELLLLQLVLAGADPGPAPRLELLLLWALAVLLPQLQGALVMPWGLIRPLFALLQLPLLLWLDGRAGLATGLSPWAGSSRAATLFWALALLLALQWQLRWVLGLIPIKPEQQAQQPQGAPLDGQVLKGNGISTGGPQSHGGATEACGSEQGPPQGPA
jgi:hypothetical protein